MHTHTHTHTHNPSIASQLQTNLGKPHTQCIRLSVARPCTHAWVKPLTQTPSHTLTLLHAPTPGEFLKYLQKNASTVFQKLYEVCVCVCVWCVYACVRGRVRERLAEPQNTHTHTHTHSHTHTHTHATTSLNQIYTPVGENGDSAAAAVVEGAYVRARVSMDLYAPPLLLKLNRNLVYSALCAGLFRPFEQGLLH